MFADIELIAMLMMVVMVMAAVMAIAVASAPTAAIVHGRFGRSARGQSVFFNNGGNPGIQGVGKCRQV